MPLKAQKPRLKTSDEGLTQENPNVFGQNWQQDTAERFQYLSSIP